MTKLGVLFLVSLVVICISILWSPFDPYVINTALRVSFGVTLTVSGSYMIVGYCKWRILAFVFTGVALNAIAISANGGLMPAGVYEEFVEVGRSVLGYTSLVGAKLFWLCDWIGGHMSPGDIFIIVGFTVYAVVMIKNRKVERKEWLEERN